MAETIKPIPQTIYPEKDSLDEAAEMILEHVPITDPNEMYALLMTYHNTLLKELDHGIYPLLRTDRTTHHRTVG